MNLSQFSKKEWRLFTLAAASLATVCAGWLGWNLSGANWAAAVSAGLIGGIIVGPLMVLLGSVNLKLNYLRGQIRRGHTSLREMTNIRPLLGGPPLDYGNWAADPFFLKVISQLIHRHEPNHVLECGSGTSTVFIAQTQERVGLSSSVTALEHLPKFAKRSRWLIEEHGLQTRATIVDAPLQEYTVDRKQLSWYGIEPSRFVEEPIDMLIVDGPPKSTGSLARYPAAFVLQDYLADDCVIIMDDGDRLDEERAAHRWAELLEAEIEYLGGPKGTYVLYS